jgi:anti-sigma factor RsiW
MADDFTAKLDSYLDGELRADETKAVDLHVRSCPACAADVLNRVQLKRAIQIAGKRYSPSPQFRARVQSQMATRPRLSLTQVWLSAASVIAMLLVAGVLANYVGHQRLERQHAFSEIADLHVVTLASTNPVDVVSTDRHTVKPWFQGKIPFTFNLPELSNSEFTLLGGRVVYLEQAPGAQLIYQVRKHEISVFIFQDGAVSPALRAESGPLKRVSFNLQSWSDNGLRYFVIGDASADDIRKLADLLKSAAKT